MITCLFIKPYSASSVLQVMYGSGIDSWICNHAVYPLVPIENICSPGTAQSQWWGYFHDFSAFYLESMPTSCLVTSDMHGFSCPYTDLRKPFALTDIEQLSAQLSESFTGSYQLMSTQKWMDWYVYMEFNSEGSVRGWKGDPSRQRHWNITQIGSTNKYLLSPRRWPNWYMYMQDNSRHNGNVRGWQGDPGPQGHWMITQKGTVSVGNQSLPTYVFNTERWPKRYIYMQNATAGFVRGWDGDPGIQGYFIMRKAPRTLIQLPFIYCIINQ